MGANTKIEWADHTLNFWVGCEPVSEGCDNCYAARGMKRFGQDPHERRRVSEKTIRKTLRAAKPGDKVFVNSWSDFFDPKAYSGWRREASNAMVRHRNLVFLLLTKRPVEMARWARALQTERAYSYKNIWLGVTAENQARADERIPQLLSIDWPGKKFVSIEPMIGPVDLERPWGEGVGDLALDASLHTSHLDWVICGGESGPNARPMNPQWVRRLRGQCVDANVPFFFKQWGEWAPSPGARWHHHKLARMYDGWVLPAHGGCILRDLTETHYFDAAKADGKVFRVGKKKAGRMLDGRTWEEVPE